jgi:hypothetical protein
MVWFGAGLWPTVRASNGWWWKGGRMPGARLCHRRSRRRQRPGGRRADATLDQPGARRYADAVKPSGHPGEVVGAWNVPGRRYRSRTREDYRAQSATTTSAGWTDSHLELLKIQLLDFVHQNKDWDGGTIDGTKAAVLTGDEELIKEAANALIADGMVHSGGSLSADFPSIWISDLGVAHVRSHRADAESDPRARSDKGL